MAKKNMATEEFKRLVGAVPDDKAEHRLMFRLLACGFRTNELVALKVKWINFQGATIFIPAEVAKNKKDRHVVFPDSIYASLYDQQEYREKDDYLFTQERFKDKPLSTRWIRKIFDEYQTKAGLEGYSPHSLRHYAAETMVRNKIPVNFIQQQLGHSSLNTTMIYLSNSLDERRHVIRSSNFEV